MSHPNPGHGPKMRLWRGADHVNVGAWRGALQPPTLRLSRREPIHNHLLRLRRPQPPAAGRGTQGRDGFAEGMPPRSALQPPPDAVLAAAEAVGVFRRMDLVDRHGEARVRAQLTAGRWQSPTASVVVDHNGPLTPAQRVWATLLSGPPGSLLHGLTAAQYDGFRGFDPDGIAIVVPGGSRSRRHPRLDLPAAWNVTIRWSTSSASRTSAAALSRRVPGWPAASSTPRVSASVSAEREPSSSPASSSRSCGRPRSGTPCRGAGDAATGRSSPRRSPMRPAASSRCPSRSSRCIVRRLGLPEPERQRILQTQGGTFYLDNAWTLLGIRAEIHGIPHRRIAQWDEDLLRQNDITHRDRRSAGLLLVRRQAPGSPGRRTAPPDVRAPRLAPRRRLTRCAPPPQERAAPRSDFGAALTMPSSDLDARHRPRCDIRVALTTPLSDPDARRPARRRSISRAAGACGSARAPWRRRSWP